MSKNETESSRAAGVAAWMFVAAAANLLTTHQVSAQGYRTVADATIRDAPNDNTNYGSQTQLGMKFSSVAGDSQLPIIQFNLSGAAALGPADKAFLIIQANNSQAVDMPMSVWGFPWEFWSESTVTNNIFWNQQAGIFILWPALQGTAVRGTSVQMYKIDVTDFVGWLIANNDRAPTFLIASDLNSPSPVLTSILSKEAGPNVAPYLSIQRATMSTPPPAPCSGTSCDTHVMPPACNPYAMGAACTFHPQECTAGTQQFSGSMMSCSTGMASCTGSVGTAYCALNNTPQCGGACGLCPGGGCSSDAQCFPTEVCDLLNSPHQCKTMDTTMSPNTSACPSPHMGFCWAPGNPPTHDSICF